MSPTKVPEFKSSLSAEETKEKAKKAEQAMKKRSSKDQGFFDKYSYHIVIGLIAAVCIYGFISKFTSEKIDIKNTKVIVPEFIEAHNEKFVKKQATFSVGPNQLFQVTRSSPVRKYSLSLRRPGPRAPCTDWLLSACPAITGMPAVTSLNLFFLVAVNRIAPPLAYAEYDSY